MIWPRAADRETVRARCLRGLTVLRRTAGPLHRWKVGSHVLADHQQPGAASVTTATVDDGFGPRVRSGKSMRQSCRAQLSSLGIPSCVSLQKTVTLLFPSPRRDLAPPVAANGVRGKASTAHWPLTRTTCRYHFSHARHRLQAPWPATRGTRGAGLGEAEGWGSEARIASADDTPFKGARIVRSPRSRFALAARVAWRIEAPFV